MSSGKETSAVRNIDLARTLLRVMKHQVEIAARRDTPVRQLKVTLEQDVEVMVEFGLFPKTRVLDDLSGEEIKVAEIDAMPIATDLRKGQTTIWLVCADGNVYSARKTRPDYPALPVQSTMKEINLQRNKRFAVRALNRLANWLGREIT